MARRSYPTPQPVRLAVLLLAGLAAGCGGGAKAGEAAAAAGPSDWFPAPRQAVPPYTPPPADAPEALLERYVDHLVRTTSADGLRFVQSRLHHFRREAAPLVARRIRAFLDEPPLRAQPPLVNLLQALGGSGRPEFAGVVLEVLERDHAPSVRTTALEALRDLRAVETAGFLARHWEREPELAPRRALIQAMGAFGTGEARAWLEERLQEELDRPAPTALWQEIWRALLVQEDPGACERLLRWTDPLGGPVTGPVFRAQALSVCLEMGHPEAVEEMRGFLDAERHPSAATRAIAVRSLGAAGDWEALLPLASTSEETLQQALLEALRSPRARAEAVGEEALRELAASPSLAVAAGALAELLERGRDAVLDPWLRALREYPLEPASIRALNLLARPELRPRRAGAILAGRWPWAAGDHRHDLLRALPAFGDPATALPVLRQALGEEDPEIRRRALVVAANFGEEAASLLLDHWAGLRTGHEAEGAGLQEAQDALASVASLARRGSPTARSFLLQAARDEALHDALRRDAFIYLPRALAEEALPVLVAVRDRTPRTEVRAFLDRFLADRF